MEKFQTLFADTALTISNLTVIGGEVIVLLILYFVLSRIIAFVSGKLATSERWGKHETRVTRAARLIRMILRLLVFLALVAVFVINGLWWWQGKDLEQTMLEYLRAVPPGLWTSLAIGAGKFIVLLISARYLVRFVRGMLDNLAQKARDIDDIEGNDESVTAFFDKVFVMLRTVVWILVAYFGFSFLSAPEQMLDYILIALRIYLYISIGLLIVSVMQVIVETIDALSKRYAESRDWHQFYQRLQPLVPLLRKTLEYIVYAVVATLILRELDFIAHLAKYGPGLVQAIGLFFIARVVIELVNLFIDRFQANDGGDELIRQRNATLYPLFKNVVAALIYFVAFILILRGFGFDPLPLLAGAGILGMVVGLGAQPLVEDIFSGLFIIFENSLRVGDRIKVDDTIGEVESIGLRNTKVRGRDGQLFIIRNSQLSDVVNYSRSFTNAIVNVGVDHESDIQQVYQVLESVGQELASANEDVLEPTQIDGLEDFTGPELMVRTVTRVKPGRHEEVEREYRKRIKEAFDKEGILIPFDKRWQLA